jgi:hypothetical protein
MEVGQSFFLALGTGQKFFFNTRLYLEHLEIPEELFLQLSSGIYAFWWEP